MRHLLALIAFGHGVAHMVGFVVPWRLASFPEQPYRTTILGGWIDVGAVGIRALGLLWLALALAFAAAGIAVWADTTWWRAVVPLLALASLALCLLELPETRFGLVANFAVLVLGLAIAAGPDAPVRDEGLDVLWRRAAANGNGGPLFDARATVGFPAPVQRYFAHAIAPGTPLAGAVRLTMRGEIKLGGTWRPFSGEEVLTSGGGMVWAASVPYMGLSIRGADRFVDGAGAMRWKLAGVIPVMSAEGAEVTRSAAGRMLAELIWLPSALLACPWQSWNDSSLQFHAEAHGQAADVRVVTDGSGAVQSVSFERWGNPDGGVFTLVPFGVVVEQERTFGGYTVPAHIRAGWHFGTPRFESEGEFFRCQIENAVFG